MVFCNLLADSDIITVEKSHNPYFNRWFSAIASHHSNTRFWEKSHNPYFNRWFSAIRFFI